MISYIETYCFSWCFGVALSDVESKESDEKAADKQDQPSKNVDEDTLVKKDKTTKKRKWGSKSSKTVPAAAKKPTSMEISSDSLKVDFLS